MTPEEMFDSAFTAAIQDRKDLIRFLSGVSEAQAHWHPPDREWSIAEGLEHIMYTEDLFHANLLRVIREADSSGSWDNTPAQPVKMSAAALRRREQGFVPAPESLEPRGKGDFTTMRTALLPDREACREALLAYRSRDLSRLVLPHPVYGDRHVYDVIAYAGIHDCLHHEQMVRVTQSPGYPPPA